MSNESYEYNDNEEGIILVVVRLGLAFLLGASIAAGAIFVLLFSW